MGRPNQLPQDIKEYGKASWTTAKNRYMRETIIGPRQKDQYRLVICMAGKHLIAIGLWKNVGITYYLFFFSHDKQVF